MIVAIDGPAGSGKSTIAKKVAEQLGFVYIDTGAMYRALTYGYLQAPIDFSKKEERIAFLERMKVGFNQKNEITLNDIVIKDEIRTFEVSEKVSYICSFPEIREAMTQLQRELAKKHSVIMDGRDIGTSVFPNADLKLFFVADSKERARRRQLDYLAKGIEKTVEEVEKLVDFGVDLFQGFYFAKPGFDIKEIEKEKLYMLRGLYKEKEEKDKMVA